MNLGPGLSHPEPSSDGSSGTATTVPWYALRKEELDAYMSMARLHNTAPALALVLLGAWVGVGRNLAALTNPTVWVMAFISAGVSAASMVINDYFDFLSGTDAVNAPHKPLPSGLVKPDMAVLLAGGMYLAVLIAACAMEHPAIRGIVAFSAGATALYTPLFKRVTMVKNALVACVIALAPLSGALAAGAGAAMLQRLAVPCAFAFTAIVFREVLMDCADEHGDRAAGVRTLPVVLGAPRALAVATTLLMGGGGAGLAALLLPSGPLLGPGAAGVAAAVAALPWHAQLCGAVVVGCITDLFRQVWSVYAAGFAPPAIDAAVGAVMRPMGLAIVMLAAMA